MIALEITTTDDETEDSYDINLLFTKYNPRNIIQVQAVESAW